MFVSVVSCVNLHACNQNQNPIWFSDARLGGSKIYTCTGTCISHKWCSGIQDKLFMTMGA